LARADYFRDPDDPRRDKYLVAVSAIEYAYPGAADPAQKQSAYTAALLRCLEHVASRRDCHFLFIPQLYGRVHTDVPFLRQLAAQLPGHATCEVVDPDRSSDEQRRIFGMC